MEYNQKLIQICAIGVAVGLYPAAACAQSHHLGALREWMAFSEEAAKYLDKGDYARAEERLNLAIKEIRPYWPDTRRIMARTYCELARVLYHQKRYADAEPLARWALSVRDSDKSAKPDAVFQCVYTLGLIQYARKRLGDAELLMRRALALQEQNLGYEHVNCIIVLKHLALVYVDESKYRDAEPLYLRAIAIHERTRPDENLDLADTALHYAALLRLMKRYDEAEMWQARALAIRDTVFTKAARGKSDRAQQEFRGVD